jgi:hypothetical protein
VIENLRNLKTSEIELRQQLPVLECEWLVGRLLAKRGVATARWVANTRRLSVQYDADLCGRAELVAFLQSCGVSPAVPTGRV